MKRIALLFLALFLITGFSVYGQKVAPGAMVGMTMVVPESEDITNDQFESFYEKFLPEFRKEAPSVPICLMKKIQGKRMGEYLEFYVFESLDARNEWFPKPGVSSDKAKEIFKNLGDVWDKYRKTATSVGYTDYVVLPFPGKSIQVKPGNVVIVFECEITLEEGLSVKDFEKFYLEDYVPMYLKHFPGTQFCILKGERGERTGKYTELMFFKSMEDYHKWVTEDGMPTEKTKKAFSDMGEVQQRMEKMYTWSRYNDYIVL